MGWESEIFATVLDVLVVTLAVLALVFYLRHRHAVSSQGYTGGFVIILIGMGAVSIYYFSDLLVRAIPSFQQSASSGSPDLDWEWSFVLIGNIAIYLGLLVLFTTLIPKSSRYLSELETLKSQLSNKNTELESVVSERTRALSESNHKLRKVVDDHNVSKIALLQSEKKFRTLFDESPTIFLTVTRDQVISDINLYGARVLGLSSVDIVGKDFSYLLPLDEETHQRQFIDQRFIEKSRNANTQMRFQLNNGEVIWFKTTASVIQETGCEEYLLMVCQDISESKKLAETLKFQASHDDLTELYNRRALEQYLNDIFERQSLFSKPAAFFYIDVDQLKVVNDTCGHIAGDELLKQLVTVIGDAGKGHDMFARIGGDEFAMIKEDTSKEEALGLAETIRSAAEDLIFIWGSQSFRQSVSIGIALTSPRICTLTDIFGAADAACYLAKEGGRNRVVLHKESREAIEDSRHDMHWVSRLQRALAEDRFELFFQPIVNLRNPHDGYIHYEMLLRGIDIDGRHIQPDIFLPAAERFGISNQIDLWVVNTTLNFLKNNPQHTRELRCCSINLSSNSLANEQTRSAIKQLVIRAGIPINKICFEITETTAIRNLTEATEFIEDLKSLGCRFALDDFGTGFSSLGYLKALAVDYLKIDGSFVKDIVEDRIDRAMVTAISSIGRAMDIITIAEYVENEQTLKTLISIDVDLGQGIGLAKPMPLSSIHKFYRTEKPDTTIS